jgi:hypothetical protein
MVGRESLGRSRLAPPHSPAYRLARWDARLLGGRSDFRRDGVRQSWSAGTSKGEGGHWNKRWHCVFFASGTLASRGVVGRQAVKRAIPEEADS